MGDLQAFCGHPQQPLFGGGTHRGFPKVQWSQSLWWAEVCHINGRFVADAPVNLNLEGVNCCSIRWIAYPHCHQSARPCSTQLQNSDGHQIKHDLQYLHSQAATGSASQEYPTANSLWNRDFLDQKGSSLPCASPPFTGEHQMNAQKQY